MKLNIVSLYPNELNTYGDRGNLLTLSKRAEWHGLDVVLHYYHAGARLPKEIDIVLGGGGPDSAQSGIQTDILRIGDKLNDLVTKGVPMLLVCGSYQLFGNRFVTHEGKQIQGIGVFDMETVAGNKRLIGNVAVQTRDFGMLYGFENHSGKTYLSKTQPALGKVTRGQGNNGGGDEGARSINAIGTYLHGPALPNNPALADGLIQLALEKKGVEPKLKPIDDSPAEKARLAARDRKY